MKIDSQDLLNSILESLERIEYIKAEDIPNIDLYMDQVTTFMDKKLRATVRYPGEDKILTKTMINNYAKNHLLPSPDKKKYSKEHILLLIFIYYYKGILSITDIQTLLEPITDKFFQNGKKFDLESVYTEVFSMEKQQVEMLKADVIAKYNQAGDTFQDAEDKDKEFLRKFAFICMLSFDVYVKKLIIEKMIDEIAEAKEGAKKSCEKQKPDKASKTVKTGKEE